MITINDGMQATPLGKHQKSFSCTLVAMRSKTNLSQIFLSKQIIFLALF